MPIVGTGTQYTVEPYAKTIRSHLDDEAGTARFEVEVGTRTGTTIAITGVVDVTLTNQEFALLAVAMPEAGENWHAFSKRLMYGAIAPKLSAMGYEVSTVE